ncbi:MAG: energy transducer TonB [candidate division Zixibacteria bacterium]|nr:energy transducer TonB [candidate division Zixibacteria bacterium]
MRRLFFLIIILLIALICSVSAYAKYPPPEELLYSDDPVLLKQNVPDFPKFLDSGDLPVTVTIQAYISKKGKVKAARVVNGPLNNPKLEKLCIKSTKKIKFYPARIFNLKVPVWSEYTLTFNADSTLSSSEFTTKANYIFQDILDDGRPMPYIPHYPGSMPVLKNRFNKGFKPVYPEKACRDSISGKVELQVFVDPKGKVIAFRDVQCDNPGYGFEEATTKAAFKSKYKPAQNRIESVATWISYTVSFSSGCTVQVNPIKQENTNTEFDTPPEFITEVCPKYPVAARNKIAEGYVIILSYIDEYGKVTKAHAINCSNPGFGFEQATVNAAYKYTFFAAKNNGAPIGCWICYMVNYGLVSSF